MNLTIRIAIIALTVVCVGPIRAAEVGGKTVVDPMPLTVFTGLTNVVQVAAGPQHIVGIQLDGTLAFWATPTYLSNPTYKSFPSNLTSVIQVSAVWHHGIALTADGYVTTWGDSFNSATIVPSGLSNVVAVAAGTSVSYALKKQWDCRRLGRQFKPSTNPTRITDQCCRDCRRGRVVCGVAIRPNNFRLGQQCSSRRNRQCREQHRYNCIRIR